MTGEAEFAADASQHREAVAMLAARLAPQSSPGKVARDAYALAERHRSDFDPQRTELRSWLLAIAAHCADAARAPRGRAAAPVGQTPGATASTGWSILDDAVDALPDRPRFAIECVDFVGLSVRETAELMGVSDRSVRSALAAGQRRISTLLGAGDAPGGDEVGVQLRAAGSLWRNTFREQPRPDLQEYPAPLGVSSALGHGEQPASDTCQTGRSSVDGTRGPVTRTSRRRRRTRWALVAIGIAVLVAGSTVAGLTEKRTSKNAAADQDSRAFQMCGQIPPGLVGLSVRRLGGPTDGRFQVRFVASRPMKVVAATVTGVDDSGRIATYVKPDGSAELYVSVVKLQDAGIPMVITSSVATDPCDGSRPGARQLAKHLLVATVGGAEVQVMDAGPVDQLPFGEDG